MYIAKIEKGNVKLVDAKSGALKRSIMCSVYKGAQNAVMLGDDVTITCGDGRTRIFTLNGALKRVL